MVKQILSLTLFASLLIAQPLHGAALHRAEDGRGVYAQIGIVDADTVQEIVRQSLWRRIQNEAKQLRVKCLTQQGLIQNLQACITTKDENLAHLIIDRIGQKKYVLSVECITSLLTAFIQEERTNTALRFLEIIPASALIHNNNYVLHTVAQKSNRVIFDVLQRIIKNFSQNAWNDACLRENNNCYLAIHGALFNLERNLQKEQDAITKNVPLDNEQKKKVDDAKYIVNKLLLENKDNEGILKFLIFHSKIYSMQHILEQMQNNPDYKDNSLLNPLKENMFTSHNLVPMKAYVNNNRHMLTINQKTILLTPLAASFQGSGIFFELLLNYGVDIDEVMADECDGGVCFFTVLSLVCRNSTGNSHYVEKLHKRGASLAAVSHVSLYNKVNNSETVIPCHAKIGGAIGANYTPLHYAQMGLLPYAVTSYLLANNALVNAVSINGKTPLHILAAQKAVVEKENENAMRLQDRRLYGYLWTIAENDRKERMKTLESLIQAGANLNAQDSDGNTALHLAAAIGDMPFVEGLLLAGADHTIQNNKNKLPHDVQTVVNSKTAAHVKSLLEGYAFGYKLGVRSICPLATVILDEQDVILPGMIPETDVVAESKQELYRPLPAAQCQVVAYPQDQGFSRIQPSGAPLRGYPQVAEDLLRADAHRVEQLLNQVNALPDVPVAIVVSDEPDADTTIYADSNLHLYVPVHTEQ